MAPRKAPDADQSSRAAAPAEAPLLQSRVKGNRELQTVLEMAGSTKIKTAEKLTDTIDADCQDLLGLAGARIFSNLQCLCPDLDLLNIL
jgi:hypothetical protein